MNEHLLAHINPTYLEMARVFGPSTSYKFPGGGKLAEFRELQQTFFSQKVDPLERGSTLAEVFPNDRDPLTTLHMWAKIYISEFLATFPSSRVEALKATAPLHMKSAEAIYEEQLLDFELKSLLASGFCGPHLNERALDTSKAHIWGDPRSRHEQRHSFEKALHGARARLSPGVRPVYSISEAIDQIIHWREQGARIYEEWLNRPALRIFGTARDNRLSPDVEVFVDELARLFVEKGVSCIHGLGDGGAMGIASLCWKFHIENQKRDSDVIVGGVPLLFLPDSDITEKRSNLTSRGAVSPAHLTFESRTLLLFSLGIGLANIFLPGGFGTDEERSRNLLWMQMRNRNHTVYSGQGPDELSPNYLIDQQIVTDKGETEWYLDGLLKHHANQLALSTVSPQDFALDIIRIGNPEVNPIVTSSTPFKTKINYFSSSHQAAEFVLQRCTERIKLAKEKMTQLS